MKTLSNMTVKQQVESKINELAFLYDEEPVCYIEQHDDQGSKVREIDGSYCRRCANEMSHKLDEEHGGAVYHQVCEESMPENEGFSHCAECGCLLGAALILSFDAEDDLDEIITQLREAKDFSDITSEMAWRINQFLRQSESYTRFKNKMAYVDRRLITLFKKSGLTEE